MARRDNDNSSWTAAALKTAALGLALGLSPVADGQEMAVPVGMPPAANAPPVRAVNPPRPAASIVGRVDDKVILLEEVIGPIRGRLEEARAQLSPEEYRKIEAMMLKQVTQARVDRAIILKELENRLKDVSVLKKVREAAAHDFEKYLLKLARDNKLNGVEEVLAQLQKEGASIEQLREDFVNDILAQQYLSQMIRSQVKEPTREDLFVYYQAHQGQFQQEVGAVWRHVEVSFGSNREAARAKAIDLQSQLAKGGDWAVLAKKASDGPTAVEGGLWSLTSKNSYAEKVVDEAIFTLPVGQVSAVLEGSNSYHIVRVEKRNDGGAKAFAEVQDEIRRELRNEMMQAIRKEKLDEMKARHYVETAFDDVKLPSRPGQQARKEGPATR